MAATAPARTNRLRWILRPVVVCVRVDTTVTFLILDEEEGGVGSLTREDGTGVPRTRVRDEEPLDFPVAVFSAGGW
ncbi:hypothetical protein GCM10009840_01760 [Pseudolysinimonas kribbensis]|uniref:Secreted protein n=1 Tax=Pseudolysinimonas kribbensis TaxID=433641 RepID=A0ABQ6K1H3_9MICO|nr:hypothetical protein GCM10025881_12790 [Pseudolysinimonas kribbensis]